MMGDQQFLFDLNQPTWIERIWRLMDPETRRKVIAILAEMGRTSLVPNRRTARKEGADEP
jgi:hypothetical protein